MVQQLQLLSKGCSNFQKVCSLPLSNEYSKSRGLTNFLVFLGSEVHFQCDVIQCKGGCIDDYECPGDVLSASSVKGKKPTGNGTEDGSNPAATTVFVLDPADAPCKCLFGL